ncbi:MAG TPA: hypothetical protein VK918_03635 [Pyrinomonadaceae bacterium]|nr:hypothetical protein [Pyrinomonadaceae bacterium]
MKRFIISIFCTTLFFVMVGGFVDGVGARFKSDQKALEIVAKARQAIGGDAAIAEVRGMVIKAQTTHMIKTDSTENLVGGETEITLMLPDKMMRTVKIGNGEAATGERHIMKSHDVVIMKKGDGENVDFVGKDGVFTSNDGKTVVVRVGPKDGSAVPNGEMDAKVERVIVRGPETGGPAIGVRQNELLRITLMLLVTAPEGHDVAYTYEGEGSVDGTAVDIVAAKFGGATYRLHFDKFTSLPVAIGYSGPSSRIFKVKRTDGQGGEVEKIVGPEMGGETLMKLSDFRTVGGVQLPHRWASTVNGQPKETLDILSYEINPADIAEKFTKQRVLRRSIEAQN